MTVEAALAAHTVGDLSSLRRLAAELSRALRPVARSTDPVEVLSDESAGTEPGTWSAVRAARDLGQISSAEYDYLSAAVAASTPEDR